MSFCAQLIRYGPWDSFIRSKLLKEYADKHDFMTNDFMLVHLSQKGRLLINVKASLPSNGHVMYAHE